MPDAASMQSWSASIAARIADEERTFHSPRHGLGLGRPGRRLKRQRHELRDGARRALLPASQGQDKLEAVGRASAEEDDDMAEGHLLSTPV
jgi:hypothetical protein